MCAPSKLFVLNVSKLIMPLLGDKYRCSPVKEVSTAKEIRAKILKLLHSENTLQQYVDDLEQKKLISWKKYDVQNCLFPELVEHDIRNITR